MTNAELITELTYHASIEKRKLLSDAAEALEAAEKRIADLEAQMSKEGEWEKAKPKGIVSYSDGYAECSNCHDTIWLGWKMHYCPNCGARMQTVTDCRALEEGER